VLRVLPQDRYQHCLPTLRKGFVDAIGRISLTEWRKQSFSRPPDFFLAKPNFPGSIDELTVLGEKSASSGEVLALRQERKLPNVSIALRAGFDATR